MLQPFRMANSEIRVRLQRAEGSTLPIDPVFGTKLGTIEQQYDTAISLYGQPRFQRSEELQAGPAGDPAFSRGYITFSARELSKKNITPPSKLKNARVVGIKRLHNAAGTYDTVNFLIVEVRARGHLTGGPILYKAYIEKFKDIHGSSKVSA